MKKKKRVSNADLMKELGWRESKKVDVLRFHCRACGLVCLWKTHRIPGKTGGTSSVSFPCHCGEETLGLFLDMKGRWHADCA